MSDSSPRLALPYLQPSQAQKHVTHNEALRKLDAFTQLAVLAFDAETPPTAPVAGDAYALGDVPTGAWAGQAGRIAVWDGVAWGFTAPAAGVRAWDLMNGMLRVFDGAGWVPAAGSLQNLDGVGIATTWDSVNRLAVSAPATLLGHAGGSHRLKIDKAVQGETASLLFQTGFSGRAEIGLAGDDNLSVKVSSDGTAWTDALIVDAASGTADVAIGLSVGGSVAYHRGNVLGTVSQSGGDPTAAAIERGSNSNGEYVRFADGTQLCWHEITTDSGSAVEWDYPAVFSSRPTGVSVTNRNSGSAYIGTTNGPGSASAVFINLWNTSGVRVSADAGLIAVGRWFEE